MVYTVELKIWIRSTQYEFPKPSRIRRGIILFIKVMERLSCYTFQRNVQIGLYCSVSLRKPNNILKADLPQSRAHSQNSHTEGKQDKGLGHFHNNYISSKLMPPLALITNEIFSYSAEIFTFLTVYYNWHIQHIHWSAISYKKSLKRKSQHPQLSHFVTFFINKAAENFH